MYTINIIDLNLTAYLVEFLWPSNIVKKAYQDPKVPLFKCPGENLLFKELSFHLMLEDKKYQVVMS